MNQSINSASILNADDLAKLDFWVNSILAIIAVLAAYAAFQFISLLRRRSQSNRNCR